MAVINLTEATGYVSGLINSADWITINDAVLNATTTVTSVSAEFTQEDRGKYASITNGAVGGKPFIGMIASVTNATTIVLDTATTGIGTGFSMSYGGVTEDPRHPLWKITKAVLQKDLEICHAILGTPNHPRRNHFTFTPTTTAQTGTGVPMVTHSGWHRMVEIQHTDDKWRIAKELGPEWLSKLTTWINNRSNLFTAASEGYFCLFNGQLYFTGTHIRVTAVDLVTDSDACQAPQEYTGIVALLAAADLFATEGDDLNATQLLSTLGGQTAAALIAREGA